MTYWRKTTMTDNALQSAIRNLNGKAQIAIDKEVIHRERAEFHDAQANDAHRDIDRYLTAIEAIQEVMPRADVLSAASAAAVFDDGVEPPAKHPAKYPQGNFRGRRANGPTPGKPVVFDR